MSRTEVKQVLIHMSMDDTLLQDVLHDPQKALRDCDLTMDERGLVVSIGRDFRAANEEADAAPRPKTRTPVTEKMLEDVLHEQQVIRELWESVLDMLLDTELAGGD